MKPKTIQMLSAMALLCCASWAEAAITCTPPVSSGFSTAYAPAGVVPNVTQGTVSFTCTRGAAGDPTNLLLRGDNGLNAGGGGLNRAALAGSFILYDGYQNSTCTTLWTRNNNASSIPFTLAANLSPQTINLSYWGCIITAGQIAPAGIYTDTVTMYIRNTGGGTVYSSGTFPVSISNPATCTLSTPPGNIVFSYTAFSPTPVLANTSFTTDCTLYLPYTISLDVAVDVVTGLNYTLGLGTVANAGGVNPLITTGSGAVQTFYINGSMAAGQAGTCSAITCPGTQVRTLTITY